MKIDLHSHSHCSDGVLSPTELVLRAVEKGVDALAITDHDTVAGLAEAKQTIAEQQLPLQLINGVEISTSWQAFEIHIVGLNIDPNNSQFLENLAGQQQRRLARGEEMAHRLAKHNIPDVLPAVLALAQGAALTRTHFARHLVNIGQANSMNNVFKKFLGRGKIGYVPNSWVDMAEAVQWIQAAGGEAVLAHPLKYKLNTKWLKRLLADFSGANGDAVEIISPQQTPQQRRDLWALCQEHGLTASVGSDFHQPTTWNELGKNLYLPDDVLPVWHHWPLAQTAASTLSS
jgi:3',5'-nucleoside bisphosphate phosphatase